MTDDAQGFTLTRLFDATPEEIWSAWTDPDEIAEWWHPRGLTTPRDSVDVDLEVGGKYAYTMVSTASEETYPTGGEYREIKAPEKLVFTWGEPGDADAPVVTVSIRSAGELTRLTFELAGVDGEKGDDSFYDGWDQALDALADHLDPAATVAG
ncbi:SRPBCC domain-containing protein [Rathayibacter sp. VKM Ac-2760]|uniref:SRPBCC family protein n=1 Tax=Rathayibacter sp. VKM Ac-2760 TaxID=2609253 RepID=UPI001317F10C|nr:SRPBCC domain-containing protein [Rathayibacter sp. VKM Ac-2760]QHC60219.1 SRPBCC domain-containing protein [Rathayibacter sp. VKM Ac-2760]